MILLRLFLSLLNDSNESFVDEKVEKSGLEFPENTCLSIPFLARAGTARTYWDSFLVALFLRR